MIISCPKCGKIIDATLNTLEASDMTVVCPQCLAKIKVGLQPTLDDSQDNNPAVSQQTVDILRKELDNLRHEQQVQQQELQELKKKQEKEVTKESQHGHDYQDTELPVETQMQLKDNNLNNPPQEPENQSTTSNISDIVPPVLPPSDFHLPQADSIEQHDLSKKAVDTPIDTAQSNGHEFVCPSCGVNIKKDAKACYNCGQEFDWTDTDPIVKQTDEKQSNHNFLVAFLILVATLFLVLLLKNVSCSKDNVSHNVETYYDTIPTSVTQSTNQSSTSTNATYYEQSVSHSSENKYDYDESEDYESEEDEPEDDSENIHYYPDGDYYHGVDAEGNEYHGDESTNYEIYKIAGYDEEGGIVYDDGGPYYDDDNY